MSSPSSPEGPGSVSGAPHLPEGFTDLWLGDHGVAATVSRATGVRPQDVQSQAAQQMVTGRFTGPEEVADLVLILASDRTANITGADITIDGGLIPTW